MRGAFSRPTPRPSERTARQVDAGRPTIFAKAEQVRGRLAISTTLRGFRHRAATIRRYHQHQKWTEVRLKPTRTSSELEAVGGAGGRSDGMEHQQSAGSWCVT
jgi:hypothetical protein